MTNALSLIASTPVGGLGTQAITLPTTSLWTMTCQSFLPYFPAGTPAQSTSVANNAQQITAVADSSGSLNSTFFTFYVTGNAYGYYVWYNINSAGVDPAPAGLTGIQVTAATNATANTIAGNTRTAITAAVPYVTISGTTSHVIITQNFYGAVTAAADGTAATGFTFAASSPAGTFGTPPASGLVIQLYHGTTLLTTSSFPTPTQPMLSASATFSATAGDAASVVLSSLSTADSAPNAIKSIMNIFQGPAV